MRALSAVVLVMVAACASAGEPGWANSGSIPWENAKSRCQIETQTVDSPAWETCMHALGWRRSS